ncbi:hypothetical protein CFP56_040497 [Quercus suber]|uniref:Uncharacterized protein n=1 Tax=Quercus suber TaxID=58331 RepID=A0AAW0LNT8_QUESU
MLSPSPKPKTHPFLSPKSKPKTQILRVKVIREPPPTTRHAFRHRQTAAGNSESGTILTEIIKSEEKLYAALHKVKSANHATISAIPQSVEVQVSSPGASSGTQVLQEQKIPKPEPSTQTISAQTSSQAINLGIEFVPAVLPEPSGVVQVP